MKDKKDNIDTFVPGNLVSITSKEAHDTWKRIIDKAEKDARV